MNQLILKIGRHKFYPYFCLIFIIISFLKTDPFNEEINWRYLTSFFGAVTGLICVILLAKRHYVGNYFGLLSTMGESLGNFLGGNIGAGLPHLYYLLTHIFALLNWRKHQDSEDKVITRKLSIIHIILIIICFSLSVVFNVYLTFYTGVENTLLQLAMNSIIFGIGVLAQTLLMLRFSFSWYLWIILNIFVIGLNIYTNNPIIATQYSLYLFNAIYGLTEWKHEQTK